MKSLPILAMAFLIALFPLACSKTYTLAPAASTATPTITPTLMPPSNTATNTATPAYPYVTTFAGGGSAGATVSGSQNGTGTAAEFNWPDSLALDGSGNLYVGDKLNNLVRKITPAGVVSTLAGGGSPGGTTRGYINATGTAAEFFQPFGVAVDNAGNVYVADHFNSVIRKITPAGVVTTLAGGGSPGGTAAGYIDATGTSAEFNLPIGIAVDTSGNVYVADTSNNLIRMITSAGVVTTLAGGGSPGGTASGYINATGTAAEFSSPWGLAIDTSGNLYVGDTGNEVIRVITPAGVVSTLAGGGSPGGTASGYINATGTSAEFKDPWGVAVDNSGNVYVADNLNALVREITPGGVVTTLAGGGSPTGTLPGYQDGVASSAMFYGLWAVAVDSTGDVYVADTQNNLIREIHP